MNESQLIDLARTLAARVERPERLAADVDTVHALCELATDSDWGTEELAKVDLFAKQIDIGGKLVAAYSKRGRKKSKQPIVSPALLEIAAALVGRAFMRDVANDEGPTRTLKRVNALLKAVEMTRCEWAAPGGEIAGEAKRVLERAVVEPEPAALDVATPVGRGGANGSPTTLPLTVLFYEGPIARAYLETLAAMGSKVQKIIHLIPARDVVTGKPVGRWLPHSWRAAYAHSIQRGKIHYWPRQIARRRPALREGFVAAVCRDFGFERPTIDAAGALRDLANFSNAVEPVLIDKLGDESLRRRLEEEPKSVVLYTGGGIVPKKLLSIPQLEFLHLHPGHLPEIRGADCTLWSSLLTGHPSASAFYMAPGIDTGDVILARWLPRPKIVVPTDAGVDLVTKYRAVYGYLDPWVRAFVLRELVATHDSFSGLPATPQETEGGTTFHFMHAGLREVTMRRLLPSA